MKMIIAGVLIYLYMFFIMYVASMNMIRAHDDKKLNGLLWVLCVPFVAVSLVIDLIANLTLFTLLYWELPRELLVTSRLKRHVRDDNWRGKLTRWIAVKILNPFDYTGDHLD